MIEDDAAPAHASLARKWVAHGSSALLGERATGAHEPDSKKPRLAGLSARSRAANQLLLTATVWRLRGPLTA